jgi:threonine/homoserine/homoserine lactone efflux protein
VRELLNPQLQIQKSDIRPRRINFSAMEASSLLIFVPACFALNMAPGPNNLLSVSNAARYGFRRSVLGGMGRMLAFAGMLVLASLGLAVVLQASALVFNAIRWLGAAYLLYLSVQLWRAVPQSQTEASAAEGRSSLALARQEFWVAAGNPKAILIFTAFLPQFVNPQLPATAQFAVLGALFLGLELVAIGLYAGMGLHMQKLFNQPGSRRLFNRVCAALLASAAVGLLLAQR